MGDRYDGRLYEDRGKAQEVNIMGKKLSEMSSEELWQLFPIFLTKHKDCWNEWYAEEESILTSLLPDAARIGHIGSTAVDGIWAKPIIDILIELPGACDLSEMKDRLTGNDYLCMSRNADRISLNKGYTENGFADKVFHVHLRYIGDNDELYFRDYLREHSGIAEEYEKLKLRLWKAFEYDRDAYTNAKTAFVKKYTEEARLIYGDRYGKAEGIELWREEIRDGGQD